MLESNYQWNKERTGESTMMMDREGKAKYVPTREVTGKCFVNGFKVWLGSSRHVEFHKLLKKSDSFVRWIGEKQRSVSKRETRVLVSENQNKMTG